MNNLGPPQPDVLRAFGTTQEPVRLTGGQGGNYRSGDVILKPANDDEETLWIADFYLSVEPDGFRVPQPVRSDSGGFVFGGWQAWKYIEGEHKKDRWEEVVEICNRFHQAISKLPRPSYFARRDQNPWVIADQVTWGEKEIKHHPRIAPVVEQLRGCLEGVKEQPQLIHGDFGGNVLFSDEVPPAIIDFSPYWRPAAFAVGVVIADAIVWEGAEMSLMGAGNRFPNFYQHLVRAELRRVIEIETLHQQYGWDMIDQIEAHLPLVEAIVARKCHSSRTGSTSGSGLESHNFPDSLPMTCPP